VGARVLDGIQPDSARGCLTIIRSQNASLGGIASVLLLSLYPGIDHGPVFLYHHKSLPPGIRKLIS
jgi:hypothetical protein